MSIPQGSVPFNGERIDRLTASIDAAKSPAEVQALVDEAAASLAPVKASITSQLAKLSPMAALLDPPTSPDRAVTWISDFITGYLQPMIAPTVTYPLQMAQITQKTADLAAAVDRARARIPNCDVTVPII